MPSRAVHPVLAALGASLLLPLLAWSQGPLTPPGPPAPSMKTLAQVEPRTPISSLPFTITNPGSYYLTTNLTGGAGQNGIIIQADRVSIDLAGFALAGAPGSLSGIVVPAAQDTLSLQHGTIANWGAVGADTGNARNSHLEHLRVCGNGSHGLISGFGALVRDCVAAGNLGDGIQLTAAGYALENNCQTNGSTMTTAGLHVLGNANRIEANHVGHNVGIGLKVDGAQNLVIKNSAYGNTAADYSIAAANDYGQILGGLGAGFTNSNPWANFGSQAAAPTCTDGIKNGTETDVDCGGGTCPPCANGKQCAANADCASGICMSGICQAGSSCTDGIKDGNETDVDCGGGTCPPCANGKLCFANTDCASGICMSGICQAAPSCTDGIKDGAETDVDCGGGTCPACANGKQCLVDSDCASFACDALSLTCVSSQCADHRKDGAETDVDCGGGTCNPCATGKQCQLDSDCVSSACDAISLLCVSNQCADHRKDGAETDVDCGGGTCNPCATGKQCFAGSDCTSGICSGGLCQ